MNGKKAQIVNLSLDSLDDRFAKTIVKIFSKLFFNYAKSLEQKASQPFNIFLEEAHRYVQNDTDINVLGYNIFERISKEGRKYGVLLGLIILIIDILNIKTFNYKYFYIDKNDLDDLIIKKDNYIKKRKNILTNNIIRGKYK